MYCYQRNKSVFGEILKKKKMTTNQFNKPAIYHHGSSKVAAYFAGKALQKFEKTFNWRPNGNDSWLDAGSGPGNVTVDIVLPMLPANFKRLVGVDISEEMISYARREYSHPKVSYEILDLNVALEKQPLNGIEPFDHISTFFVMMYIKNQKVCIENFYKLLKPGGDIVLSFLAKHPIYDAYEHFSETNRWSKYMKDFKQESTPYQHSKDATEEFRSLLENCGFTECDVEFEEELYTFEKHEQVRDLFHSISPFIDRIPADEQQAFLDDLLDYFRENGFANGEKDGKTGLFRFAHGMMVAYARKPENQ